MPELPEVETIRQQLLKILPFKIEKAFFSEHAATLIKKRDFNPQDLTITSIGRKGKLLIFGLELEEKQDKKKSNRGIDAAPKVGVPDYYLLSHLGMSGSWRIGKEKISAKHTHLQLFRAESGNGINKSPSSVAYSYLAYVDPRRFGRLFLVNKENSKAILENLGVDLASADFTADYLYQMVHRYPCRPIKNTLLDQKLFAGTGNYLANEMCARAGVLPTRSCESITRNDCKKMKTMTERILANALKSQGTTFHGGYADTKGEKGEGLKNLMVFYQKTCQGCLKTPVQKIYLNGRGTYFCPRCQR